MTSSPVLRPECAGKYRRPADYESICNGNGYEKLKAWVARGSRGMAVSPSLTGAPFLTGDRCPIASHRRRAALLRTACRCRSGDRRQNAARCWIARRRPCAASARAEISSPSFHRYCLRTLKRRDFNDLITQSAAGLFLAFLVVERFVITADVSITIAG